MIINVVWKDVAEKNQNHLFVNIYKFLHWKIKSKAQYNKLSNKCLHNYLLHITYQYIVFFANISKCMSSSSTVGTKYKLSLEINKQVSFNSEQKLQKLIIIEIVYIDKKNRNIYIQH